MATVTEHPLRQELRISNIGLDHSCPQLFVSSQWTSKLSVYIVWRVLWCLALLALTIASGVDFEVNGSDQTGAKWFISFGHWTLLLAALTCTLDLVNTFCAPGIDQGDSTPKNTTTETSEKSEDILFHGNFTLISGLEQLSLPWFSKLVWLLYNVNNSLNIVWTVVFWAVDYNDSSREVDMISSVAATVFVLANLFFTAMPVQILHTFYPVVGAALYAIFTAIYHACGGSHLEASDHVFPGIDWDEVFPTAVTVIVGLLIVVPMGHMVTFAFYTFRTYVFSKANFSSYPLSNAVNDSAHKQRDNQNGEPRSDSQENHGIEMPGAGSGDGSPGVSQPNRTTDGEVTKF